MPTRLPDLDGIFSKLVSLSVELQVVINQLQGVATETSPGLIQFDTENTYNLVRDGTFGLQAIQAQLATFQATTAVDVTAILAAIAACQQTGLAVTLPGSPPAGYGGPSSSSNAAAVWAFHLIGSGQLAGDALDDAAALSHDMSDAQVGLPTIGNPPWIGQGSWGTGGSSSHPDINLPQVAVSTILQSDLSATDWLNRVYPAFGTFTEQNGYPTLPDWGGGIQWVLPWDQEKFDRIKATFALPVLSSAPVWPGLANVALGTPVVIADGAFIPGPMSGVVVHISAVPVPISYYPFGPLKSFVHAGAIAFVDDNGDAEFPHTFGPEHDVICPKVMAIAAHAYLRSPSGVIGTVTPWTTP